MVIIFRDEAVNFSIQKGIQASRSEVRYFRHNDMNDLEELLKEQNELDRRVSFFICINCGCVF